MSPLVPTVCLTSGPDRMLNLWSRPYAYNESCLYIYVIYIYISISISACSHSVLPELNLGGSHTSVVLPGCCQLVAIVPATVLIYT